jgi:hypothetical protein
MQTTDLLILAVARLAGGLTIAGMTTERDEKTGLRWARPIPEGGVWAPDDLRYGDGSLVQPGDVVRMALGVPQPAPPFIENVPVSLQVRPLERIRRLAAERRTAFFDEHLDQAPAEVLRERTRSLCLIRPDFVHAIVSCDSETGKFETRLALMVGRLKSNEEGIAVTDIYWRAFMRTWLGDEEYLEIDDSELLSRLGELYAVVGLGRKAGPVILGVHTVPEYAVTIDESAL